ncbi:disease resistance protein RPM1-like [Camellia sinensis]|uniref:disease resistance protein RPM1-like n=1 Tax=Camellia sinensis TaxID=4442 RepID=UPI0010360AC1|nr:disease resistance protein RPM1-like [Camellia sinensis]
MVSQSFTAAKLLCAVLKDFLEETKEPIPEGIDTMGEIQLINMLRDHLQQKRYVIVFDDVWSINASVVVKFALPDCCCGSRIVFTTQIGDVATSTETTSHVYQLQPLPEEEAWMPFSIVAIGCLLPRKNKHLLEQKKVRDNLSVEVKRNSSLERILMLSYIDLPYHLKYCFSYLNAFPEDCLIRKTKLTQLWVVKRFVEEIPVHTTEEATEKYLNELVSRSTVQVVEKDYSNRDRTCRVHDIIRDIIQSKSRDESLLMILNDMRMSLDEKIQRMLIHDSCKELPLTMRFTSLRSLLVLVSIDTSKS